MNLGFRALVQILFIGLLIATVTVVAAIGYWQARSGVMDASSKVIDGALEKIRERTEEIIESTHDRLDILGIAYRDRDILQEKDSILRSLWEINRQSPYVNAVFLVDLAGNYLEARTTPNLATRVGISTGNNGLEEWVFRDERYQVLARIANRMEYRPQEEPWFQRTADDLQRHLSGLRKLPVSQSPGFTLTQPLLDREGNLIGILGADIALDALNRFVSIEGIGSETTLMIVDSAGRVLAHPLGLSILSLQADLNAFLRIQDLRQTWIREAWDQLQPLDGQDADGNAVSLLSLDTGRFFVQKKKVLHAGEDDWNLLLLLPEYVVLAGVNRGLNSSIMLAIIMQIIAVYIIFVTTNQLTRPLRQIAHNARVLEDLRFDEMRPVKAGFSEFRSLDDAMQRMTSSLMALNRYIPAHLVRRLMTERHEVKLGAESRKMALINTGINGFSYIGAMMLPREHAQYLNRYQGEVFEAIRRNGGLVDRFIDDRVIGFWGAPDTGIHDAYRACCAALECHHAIHQLNQLLRWENSPPLTVRIGLHLDFCMVGNFGSEDRMFYSVVGNAVSVNYWLSNLNKVYGTAILASEAIREATAADFVWRWIDEAEFYDGKTRVRVYELCGYSHDPEVLQHQDYVSRYEDALHFYLDVGNLSEAKERFLHLQESYPEDKAIALQLHSLEVALQAEQTDGNRAEQDQAGSSAVIDEVRK